MVSAADSAPAYGQTGSAAAIGAAEIAAAAPVATKDDAQYPHSSRIKTLLEKAHPLYSKETPENNGTGRSQNHGRGEPAPGSMSRWGWDRTCRIFLRRHCRCRDSPLTV